jgi:hypothetical protein
MGSISSLNNNYLQSVLNSSLQNSGVATKSSNSTSSLLNALQPDSNQLSPFAQLMSTLQQLQQSNPTEYKQVTQQIATNLQGAAKTATADGNSTEASQLNQLATDFTNASQSGQLPNVQDLAQAVGASSGHHHHHHHAEAASSDSTTGSSSDSTSSTSSGPNVVNPQIQQMLNAMQGQATQGSTLNAMQIISSTLTSAGISLS